MYGLALKTFPRPRGFADQLNQTVAQGLPGRLTSRIRLLSLAAVANEAYSRVSTV